MTVAIPLSLVWQNCVMEWRSITRYCCKLPCTTYSQFCRWNLLPFVQSAWKQRRETQRSAINFKTRKHFRKAFQQRLAQFTWNSVCFCQEECSCLCASTHSTERARVNSLPLINLMRRACASLPGNIYICIYSGQWAAAQKMIICELSEYTERSNPSKSGRSFPTSAPRQRRRNVIPL